MPNQLSATKKRKTVAEHVGVLAALEVIAAAEGTSSTELLRSAARAMIRERARDPELAGQLRAAVQASMPKAPAARLKTPAKLARFKQRQREHDALLLELELASAEALQAKNSVHVGARKPRLLAGI